MDFELTFKIEFSNDLKDASSVLYLEESERASDTLKWLLGPNKAELRSLTWQFLPDALTGVTKATARRVQLLGATSYDEVRNQISNFFTKSIPNLSGIKVDPSKSKNILTLR